MGTQMAKGLLPAFRRRRGLEKALITRPEAPMGICDKEADSVDFICQVELAPLPSQEARPQLHT